MHAKSLILPPHGDIRIDENTLSKTQLSKQQSRQSAYHRTNRNNLPTSSLNRQRAELGDEEEEKRRRR